MKKHPLPIRLLASLFACVLFTAIAQGQVVTNSSDGSAGSLRTVLNDAAPGATITFSADMAGQTIELQASELLIAKNITLDASALPGGITIKAPLNRRAIRIDGSAGRRTVTLRGITLTGGKVSRTDSPSGGGGIYAHNTTLTLEQCLVEGNTAANGGGIFVLGVSNQDRSTLTLRNTTVHGNRVETLFPSGGGIFLDRCDATLIHATVTGNTGKYLNADGSTNTAYPNPSVDTAGGIRVVNGSLTLANSVVADNGPSFVGAYGDDILCRIEDGGTLALEGNNLIREADGHVIPSGASVLRVDPRLGPLQNNGGPTRSRLPAINSPLLDGATVLVPPLLTDQRGLPRPALNGPDIGAAELQSILVTNTNDSGPGSLRQTIADAPAGSSITFAPILSGQTITLTSGHLLIGKNLTIDASALPAGLTLSGNNASRIFFISAGNTVALHSLTLTDGSATGTSPNNLGGAIYNERTTLSLTACTLTGNSAGSGGGIYSEGSGGSATLSLTSCTLTDNSAGLGGGIYSEGSGGSATLSLTSCTLTGNSANLGGGIYSDGSNGSATLSLTSCTLTGNSADLGGGIYSEGSSGSTTLSLTNSILAGNTADTGPDLREGGSPTEAVTNAHGQNLLSNVSGSNIPSSPLPAGITLVNELHLAPLGDYGGPTKTMPPLLYSPAIDAAGSTTETTDQRGAPRVVDGNLTGTATMDIGAVEYVPPYVTSAADSGLGSLRQVIQWTTFDVITFAPDLNGQTITLSTGQILIEKSLTINASNLPACLTLSGNNASRIFFISAGNTVALHSLTLTDGSHPTTGGAIYNQRSTLSLTACTLSRNTAHSGGGIYSDSTGGSATLNLTACTLSGNTANSGGGIYNNGTVLGFGNNGATLSLTACTLAGNSADRGGGIFNYGSGGGKATLTITACSLSGNIAHSNGGGIYIDGSAGTASLALDNSIVAANSSDSQGPDVFNLSGTVHPVGMNLLSDLADSGMSQGPNVLVAAPILAPLGDYGGPTQTMPPLPGSPAIDAGGSTTESTDQRGLPRVVGAAVDIGAVEHIPGSDAPGTLAFGSALTTLLEEAGVGLVPVLRTGGSLGSVSVTVDSAPGTATAADFDAVSGLVLNFAHGETQKMVPVTVLADTLKEPTETFTLGLSNIIGSAALGTPNPGMVRIIDHAPDKAKPALTLLTPKNNEIILEAAGNVVNLTGSAKDNVGIERVEVSLDGADFLPAVLSHSADFKSCTFALPLPLTPGLRTVLVRAVDTRGLLSTTVKRSFTFRVVRPLQVTVNENGTVTKGYAGVSQRFVGVNHTITATPARGYIFDGWLTNNALTTGLTPDLLNLPKLSFIMQEGLELTARFRENPYTMVAGSYSGLLMPDLGLRGNDPGVDNTGLFNGTVTSRGTFSGTLLLNGGSARLTGIFDSQGHARFGRDLIRVLTLPRPGVDGQTTFEMRIDTDQAQLTGTLLISKNSQNQTRSSQLTADRVFFSSKYPLEEPVTEKKGRRYNLILPATAQLGLAPNLYPQGTGIGSMFVKADGKIAFVIHLADNTKFTAASTMTLFLDCPLFAQLYGKGGLFAAQIVVDPDETDTDAIGIDALWFRPAQPKATSYRAGWPHGLRMYIFGSQYFVPPAAPPMSVFPGLGAVDPANGNATLTFLDGLLAAPMAMNLNMDTTSKVTNAPATVKTFTAALAKTTGEWKGVFTHSDGKKPAWQATTFQKAGAHQGGHGFFLSVPAKPADGLAESGAVSIQAK